MKKKVICILIFLAVIATSTYAQFSSSAASVYEQSKRALRSSSFSLENTHATYPTYGSVRFSNGNKFTGSFLNGNPMSGILEEPNGTKHHCSLSNGSITGWCFTEWTDGSWYYGNWKDGVKHGEGSYYDSSGRYYDYVYSNGSVVSKKSVYSPKYSKEDFEEIEERKTQIMRDAQNELDNSYNKTNNNSSSYSSGRQKTMKCPHCNGTGRRLISTNGSLMRNQYWITCRECGQRYLSSNGHTHTSCSYCNGTGRKRL